jgi:hypothetical protein
VPARPQARFYRTRIVPRVADPLGAKRRPSTGMGRGATRSDRRRKHDFGCNVVCRFPELGGKARTQGRVLTQRHLIRKATTLGCTRARILPFRRLPIPKRAASREVTTMATWTWSSVASRPRSSQEVGSDLSTCPPIAESGQVDRLLPTSQDYEAAERAAIVERDGRIPREWAEGYARLDPDRSPGDVPARCWQQFIDDVGLFLDGPFCAVAAALGWGPYDLFGADRYRPYARIDQAGLLWLLNGDRLEALSENGDN